MVSSSYRFLETDSWPTLIPGLAIALALRSFNLLGNGLRDALDPRLRVWADQAIFRDKLGPPR